MLESIKRFLTSPAATMSPDAEDLQWAAAVLMLEVASADFELSAAEREQLLQRLGTRLDVSGKALDDAFSELVQRHDLAVSLHDQIAVLNEHFSQSQKLALLNDLWCVAYADGELHHYEEAVIRRLADLLHVPHRDFIRTKHQVSGQP